MIRAGTLLAMTTGMLARSTSLRRFVDLVNFESLGGCAVGLVAGVSCTNIKHGRNCDSGHYKKRKKGNVSGKRGSFGKVKTGRELKKVKTHAFPNPYRDFSSKTRSLSLDWRVHPWKAAIQEGHRIHRRR